MTSQMLDVNEYKTTSVSGSPKRALNSITLIPDAVLINPPYNTPQNSLTSFFKAFNVGIMI